VISKPTIDQALLLSRTRSFLILGTLLHSEKQETVARSTSLIAIAQTFAILTAAVISKPTIDQALLLSRTRSYGICRTLLHSEKQETVARSTSPDRNRTDICDFNCGSDFKANHRSSSSAVKDAFLCHLQDYVAQRKARNRGS